MGAIGARRGVYFTTTANCATTAKCTKHTFSYVYVRTSKLTGKSYVVYTPDVQTRSYHSAKVCWELESAAISAKIHRFNRAKQAFTFTMVPSQISSFFAFIILEIGTGHKKKWYVNFLHIHRRNVVKEKNMHGVEVDFHCSCLPSQIDFFCID